MFFIPFFIYSTAIADIYAEETIRCEKAPERNRFISEESYLAAKNRAEKTLTRLYSGIDPTILKDYGVIGAYHLETLVRTGVQKEKQFREWAKVMLAENGEKVRPYLRTVWDDIKGTDFGAPVKPTFVETQPVQPKQTKEVTENIKPDIKSKKQVKQTEPIIKKPEKIEPFIGDGETKTRGLSQTTEAKAIANDLTKGIKNLPEYNVRKNQPQIDQASKIISEDLPRAVRIALGQEEAPNTILPGFIYKGLEDFAVRNGDIKLLRKLGQSPYLSEQATTAGQFIQSLRNQDPLSPVEAMKDIIKTRQESSAFQRADKLKAEYETKIQELVS